MDRDELLTRKVVLKQISEDTTPAPNFSAPVDFFVKLTV